jgi:catechol 2,3-dioxygenase-like lactoylglutathione lyase family enzyme
MDLNKAKLCAFVPTKDAERARAFYQQTLGLHFVRDDDFALVFDLTDTMLRVVRVHELTPAPFTILGWNVDDIARTAAALGERGVKLERFPGMSQDAHGIWTAPSGDKVAWFKDPDGNVLSIAQHVQ